MGDLAISREVADLSVSDLEAALGAEGDFEFSPQTGDCGLTTHEELGIAGVTTSDLAVVALVVERDDVTTAEGIGLGSTTADVLAAYGSDNVLNDAGIPSPAGGPLLLVADADSPSAEPDGSSLHLAFETDPAGVVVRMRAGHFPAVALRDYCSPVAAHPEATGWPLVT